MAKKNRPRPQAPAPQDPPAEDRWEHTRPAAPEVSVSDIDADGDEAETQALVDREPAAREKATTLVVEPPVADVYEDLTDLPPAVRAGIVGFGLKRAEVIGHRAHDDGQGATVVTRGGRKLVWPEDREKALTLTQKDRDGQGAEAPRWFKNGIDGKRP
jgi:hypothetical protein